MILKHRAQTSEIDIKVKTGNVFDQIIRYIYETFRNIYEDLNKLSKFFNDDDDITLLSDSYVYFGDSATDGTWRMGRSGNDFIIQRRESSAYVTKQTITP